MLHVHEASYRERSTARRIAETAATIAGIACVGCAVAANQSWLDRHFLPSFLLPRDLYVRLETSGRIALAVAGVLFAFLVRPRLGRIAARAPAKVLHVTVAAVVAVGATEPVLRRIHLQPAEWLLPNEEPRRQADPQLGWTFVPSRSGHVSIGGHVVDYAIDAAGCRVRSLDEPVDRERPAILFAGESVMFGEGLTWEESVSAQVGAAE